MKRSTWHGHEHLMLNSSKKVSQYLFTTDGDTKGDEWINKMAVFSKFGTKMSIHAVFSFISRFSTFFYKNAGNWLIFWFLSKKNAFLAVFRTQIGQKLYMWFSNFTKSGPNSKKYLKNRKFRKSKIYARDPCSIVLMHSKQDFEGILAIFECEIAFLWNGHFRFFSIFVIFDLKMSQISFFSSLVKCCVFLAWSAKKCRKMSKKAHFGTKTGFRCSQPAQAHVHNPCILTPRCPPPKPIWELRSRCVSSPPGGGGGGGGVMHPPPPPPQPPGPGGGGGGGRHFQAYASTLICETPEHFES